MCLSPQFILREVSSPIKLYVKPIVPFEWTIRNPFRLKNKNANPNQSCFYISFHQEMYVAGKVWVFGRISFWLFRSSYIHFNNCFIFKFIKTVWMYKTIKQMGFCICGVTLVFFYTISCWKCGRVNVLAKKGRMKLMTVLLCEIWGSVYLWWTPDSPKI